MNQYPGYPYPAYPGYLPPEYYPYHPYAGYPGQANGGPPQQQQSQYTSSTTRHARLPSDVDVAYPSRDMNGNVINANGASRKVKRNRTQGSGGGVASKESRVLGYEPGPPPALPPKPRRGLTPGKVPSSDVLKLSGPQETVKYLTEFIEAAWPGSIPSKDGTECKVKLGREAWSANGATGIKARKLVCELFISLSQEGYRYLTTINNHPLKAPRLVFKSGPPEHQPRYFMICFSLNRRTAHIIGAPERLTLEIAKTLRVVTTFRPNEAATMPSRTDGWASQGVYEVTTSLEGGRVDFASLMSGSLKFIAAEGWQFEASVPFGRSGPLGVRGRREAWMFHWVPDFKPKQQQQQQQVPRIDVIPVPRTDREYDRERERDRDREQQRQLRRRNR
ncbi:hypothetical protein Clacol_008053 [Clathrus columnatus]|uniref:Uncharacterized protein n=1 Tax=Clathrus columnatus TaxID=1419009 RepID=A0AAV5ALI6_9AGAM|nr:hypothetical protein Clacol_008053 [Clathrus columnatus]